MKNRPMLLLILMLACSLTYGQISTKKFSHKASASISRISLFLKDGNVDPNILWSQYDATKRSSLIAVLPDGKSGVKIRVLAENSPDAAMEAISKLTNSIKYDKLDASSALEFSRNIAQIKRSSAVDNFRTISYRIAELVNNDGKLDADVKNLLDDLIKGMTETSASDNKLAEEETKTIRVKYEADLQKENNKKELIAILKEQLKTTTDENAKKEIMNKLTELTK